MQLVGSVLNRMFGRPRGMLGILDIRRVEETKTLASPAFRLQATARRRQPVCDGRP